MSERALPTLLLVSLPPLWAYTLPYISMATNPNEVAWGYVSLGQIVVPAGLSSVIIIPAGLGHIAAYNPNR